jgi:hypothetical protein
MDQTLDSCNHSTEMSTRFKAVESSGFGFGFAHNSNLRFNGQGVEALEVILESQQFVLSKLRWAFGILAE